MSEDCEWSEDRVEECRRLWVEREGGGVQIE